MNTLTATFRIVTPLFLGSANPDACAELRVPSIKASLRFWYRAFIWSRVRSASASDDEALRKLKSDEAALFGLTDEGQSKVILRLKEMGKASPIKAGDVYRKVVAPKERVGARYLGYGVMEAFPSSKKGTKAGQLTRAGLDYPLEFNLITYSKSPFHADFINTLKLLGLLGGLGSKSRKGYGSLTLLSLKGDGLEPWGVPADRTAYQRELIALLTGCPVTTPPPFSAFTNRSRVCILLEDSDPLDVLDLYGRQMQRYRSWGKGGAVNGHPSEKNFKPDHDWGKKISRPAGFHPKRAIFGLPHNYGPYPDMQVNPAKQDRRASPLLFHIHDYGNGRFAGVATVLQACFLPAGEQINAGGTLVATVPDYGAIDTFLDGYEGPAGAKTSTPYFPSATRVLP